MQHSRRDFFINIAPKKIATGVRSVMPERGKNRPPIAALPLVLECSSHRTRTLRPAENGLSDGGRK